MNKNLILTFIGIFLFSCSNQSLIKKEQNEFAKENSLENTRTILSEAETELKVDLKNIYSMQRSYWSDKKDNKDYYGKFSAFILKNNLSEEGNARLVVYIENPDKVDEMRKVVDNEKFIWGGAMTGTEPSLTVNHKNSLMIEMRNDAIGRNAWREVITAKISARTNEVEVIGYDYVTYDKLQLGNGYTCSYNFLTGKANSTVLMPNGKIKSRKVIGVKKTIKLNDWNDDGKPEDCMPE